MKHMLRLILVIAIITTVFSFTAVKPARAAGCTLLALIGPGTGHVNFIAGHHIQVLLEDIVIDDFVAGPGFGGTHLGPQLVIFTDPGTQGLHLVIVDLTGCGGVAWYSPGDDRLDQTNASQPAAIYCRQGNVQVWAVDPVTSIGKLSFVVTQSEIANVENGKPTQNTLIKASADGSLKLYYLPLTDELSLITTYPNSSKPYAFVWKGCA